MRCLLKLIICLFFAAAAGTAYLAGRSGDPIYTIYEWLSPQRFQQYDSLIRKVAAEEQLDPFLVKAIIWRESRFDPHKMGAAGERGLMQVTEAAAQEWAKENRIPDFRPEDLFDPATNVRAGSWYLRRALRHWSHQADPIPFALAEYNAGLSRARRWAGGEDAPPISAKDFRRNIDFPGTRRYVDDILDRYQFYRRRGRM